MALQEIMTDPVVLSDGCSYERAATSWLAAHSTSPVTGQPLSSKDIISNRALKSLMEALAQASQLLQSGRRALSSAGANGLSVREKLLNPKP